MKKSKYVKTFKVAHIVPVSSFCEVKNNTYFMCLAHLVENKEYAEFFRNRSEAGKFVLMDNGAAEGSQLDFDQLIEAYEKINPTEIVLPDTLYNPASTIQKHREFMNKLSVSGRLKNYRLMGVPQGENFEEWKACARILVKDTRINSIGVSKFLNVACHSRTIRFDACKYLKQLMQEYNRGDLEVHLLGCDEGPVIVNMIQKEFGFVRGCDSAFAYLAAKEGKYISLKDDTRPRKAGIDFISGSKPNDLWSFIAKFDYLAGVENNSDNGTWEMEEIDIED